MYWNHLVLIDEVVEGDYGILESISKGVACGLLSFYIGDELAVYRHEDITPEKQQCIRHSARKRGRCRYDFFIPFRIVKRVGVIGTIKLLIWLWTKKDPPPIPHLQDSYVVCSELGQESYQSCELPIIPGDCLLVPDTVPRIKTLKLIWRGRWSPDAI
jgi:hypothetical protein